MVKSKKPCEHKGKIYFQYMNGFYCSKCKDTFIDGEWTKLKRLKKKK